MVLSWGQYWVSGGQVGTDRVEKLNPDQVRGAIKVQNHSGPTAA